MTNELLQLHYDRKYTNEDSNISLIKFNNNPTNRFESVMKYFPMYFKKGNILEIGAGNGCVAKSLLSQIEDITSYTLGDISHPRLEGLKKNLVDDRVNILELDAENISTFDKKYDSIIMIALIEHLVDPLRAMQNIRKLITSDGFVYIDTPNIAKFTRRIKLLFGQFPSTASKNQGLTTYSGDDADLFDEGHLHYFTYSSLSQMLIKRCGFSRILKLSYSSEKIPLKNQLTRMFPEIFSDVAIIAYA